MAGEVTLDDGVVRLRPWRPDDAPAVHRACQDPEIRRWTTVPSPYRETDARDFVSVMSPAGWAAGSEFTFAVLAEDDVVASVGLGQRSSRVSGETGEIGYWAAPWGRGRGYVSRAVRLVCAWGFEAGGLGRINWHAEVGNGPSRLVAERCGFRVEGVLRGALARPVGRVDAWAGGLLPGDPVHGTPVEPLLPPTLRTDRLVLRTVAAADVESIVAGCSDSEVLRWTPLPSPYTVADAEAFVHGQVAAPWEGRFDLAMIDRQTHELVGVMGLFDYRRRVAQVEIGYWVAAAVRGRGYATEAVRALSDWALGDGGLYRVLLRADVDNQPSRRVAERAGFALDGVERGAAVGRDGGRRSLASYSRLAADAGLR